MRRWPRIIFLLSLGLNAFLLCRFYCVHSDRADVDFYPGGQHRAYFVKGWNQNSFTIEHEGHRFTAECLYTKTWLKGIDNPSEFMSRDSCTYMHDLVGKSVAEGIMRHEGDQLLYMPWTGQDTIQTADILAISRDEAK